jgi:hypothetical protein
MKCWTWCVVLALAFTPFSITPTQTQAGGLLQALSRWTKPAPPTPAAARAYVTVPPAAAYPAPGHHGRNGEPSQHTVPRAYPYGWFGAHARPQTAAHSSYYSDSWQTTQIRAD